VRRRLLVGAGSALALLLLTAALLPARGAVSLESVLLLFLLVVVGVAVVGGLPVALATAVAAALLLNAAFTPPYGRLSVASRDDLLALGVFVVVAATVSALVELVRRRTAQAERARSEADELSALTGGEVTAASLPALLGRVRQAFGMTSVALLARQGDAYRVAASDGPGATADVAGAAFAVLSEDSEFVLVGRGPTMFAEDRRLLEAYAAAATAAERTRQLTEQAAEAEQLAAVDRLRTALLAAVGHDLRTPLAAVKASVSSLRAPGLSLTENDRAELLATIEESSDTLDDLVSNLLDMSRLEAGVLSVRLQPTPVADAVAAALSSGGADGGAVELALPPDVPPVLADPVLLERVVANLIGNARRHTPAGTRVRVEALAVDGAVDLLVVDHGPGVPPADLERVFTPFQRLGDADTTHGVGLGLAVARGFTQAMGGSVALSATTGGGLTAAVRLPRADLEPGG